MIKVILFLIVFLTIFSGCAIHDKIVYKENLQMVNFSDGINEEEAVIIAQSYLVNNDLAKDCNISRPKVKESVLRKNCWTVSFSPSLKALFSTPYDYHVDINKITGKVEGSGWEK